MITAPGFDVLSWWWYAAGVPEAPPADLQAHLVAGDVVLDWTDTLTDNTGYDVERATGPGAFGSISTPGDVETDTDTGPFTAGQVYRYRVVAIGGASDGVASNIVNITPLPGSSAVRRRRRTGRRF